MIILHQFELSPFCDKVRRILHWKGVEYQVKDYPLGDRKALKKLSPAGKLPTLEHDKELIPDSTDIARHLEEKFPEPPLMPADPRLRGLVHVFEDWADESLYFCEMYLRFTLPHNGVRNVPRLLELDRGIARMMMQRLIPRGMRSIISTQGLARKPHYWALADITRHVQSISDCLASGDWLVGDTLTLADISVYSELVCMHDSEEGQAMVAARPEVVEWMARVEAATGAPPRGSWPKLEAFATPGAADAPASAA